MKLARMFLQYVRYQLIESLFLSLVFGKEYAYLVSQYYLSLIEVSNHSSVESFFFVLEISISFVQFHELLLLYIILVILKVAYFINYILLLCEF